MTSSDRSRRGALLIICAGLASLLAAMCFAFLVRIRLDNEEATRLAQEVQARTMLSAALMYVQETARLGWGEETYGWRDARDGMPGPRGFNGKWPGGMDTWIGANGRALIGAGVFPAIGGTAARNPMYTMRRPPYAIKPHLSLNPVPLGPADANDAAKLTQAWSALIGFANRDPQPVEASWPDFRDGDRTPRSLTGPAAWFRVRRSDVATFVLTCGAGNTMGFRNWTEVTDAGMIDTFGSQDAFDAARRDEIILWYQVEWSEMVTGNSFLHLHYARWNQRYTGDPGLTAAEAPNTRQFGGTFSYLLRLVDEPTDW
jgi:hypothetical protein